ncbi:unnamed protein product, partial [Rotaria magnacalcarata]
MYLSGNLPTSNASGESRSSYQHYAMIQVNNEKPVIHREHEEQSQSWGQPLSSSLSANPAMIDSDRNFTRINRLGSSSSSVFDRNNGLLNEAIPIGNNTNDQCRDNVSSVMAKRQQQQQEQSNASSLYTKISNATRESQAETEHYHDVPYFHGFKFQTLP